MVQFGVPGQNNNSLAYTDNRLSNVPVVDAPRSPTVNDKKFPMWCEWRVNKNATGSDAEGDFWKLVKFEANGDATWVQLDTGGGGPGVDFLRDQVNTQIAPDASGNIDVDGAAVANAANPSGLPLETVDSTNTLTINMQVAADRTGAPGDKNDAGICSFNDADFVVDTDGYVSLIGAAATSYVTDSGSAIPAANILNVLGGTGADTSGAGNTITINASAATPLSFPTDSGTATPAANALTVSGGTGVNTSGAAAVVTINIDVPVTEVNGGTGQTTYTKGDILYASAANTLSKLPIGSDGQVLKVSTDLPAWAADSAGNGWVFLGSATASTSASLEFTSLIDSTYFMYVLMWDQMRPSTDGDNLSIQSSTDNGSTWDGGATDYDVATYSSTGVNAGSISVSSGTVGNAADEYATGMIFIHNPSGTGITYFTFMGSNNTPTSGAFRSVMGTARRNAAEDVDALRILFGIGNITSGTAKLYGVCTPS